MNSDQKKRCNARDEQPKRAERPSSIREAIHFETWVFRDLAIDGRVGPVVVKRKKRGWAGLARFL